MEIEERIRGCLLGVAIGDALGAPFEHLGPGDTNDTIQRMGGFIRDFVPYQNYPPGTWTDDTGMTLATCRALVRLEKDNVEPENAFREEFYNWAGSSDCRKPGQTVLYSAKYGKTDENSWANGALMRIASVGIYCFLKGYDEKETARFAHLKKVPRGLSNPVALLGEVRRGYEDYQSKRHADHYAVHPSTGLWMWRQAFEVCLGMAEGEPWGDMPPFEVGMIKVLHHSYDKDTAGAVAGGILGVYWGEKNIPQQWKENVDRKQRIIEHAEQLLDLVSRGDKT